MIFVKIMRDGVALQGSPFLGWLYFVEASRGKRFSNTPLISKTARSQVLSLPAIANVQVGDLAMLPDGSFRKVLSCRTYDRVVQCDLQWIPYLNVSYFSASSILSGVNAGTLNVTDEAYSTASTILAYIEPLKSPSGSEKGIGIVDMRMSRIYTMLPLSLGDLIVDGDGAKWVATAPSEHYPVVDDYVATARHVI
jgi:hypothetical protein